MAGRRHVASLLITRGIVNGADCACLGVRLLLGLETSVSILVLMVRVIIVMRMGVVVAMGRVPLALELIGVAHWEIGRVETGWHGHVSALHGEYLIGEEGGSEGETMVSVLASALSLVGSLLFWLKSVEEHFSVVVKRGDIRVVEIFLRAVTVTWNQIA